MAKIAVVFHSGYGHTLRVAQSVAEGAGAELIAIDADGNLPAGGWDKPYSWILPITAYAAVPMATYARYTRSAMLDVMNKPFVTVLRAKGLSERRIIFQHILRNAALPLVTVFLPMFIGTATGSIFVEAMFRVPGLGAISSVRLSCATIALRWR